MFHSLAGELEQVDVDGSPAWVRVGDIAPPPTTPHGARLLPYFDAYTVGCHPRDRLFPGPAAQRALARGQAGNFPVLLIDGTVAGVWHTNAAPDAICTSQLSRLPRSQPANVEISTTRGDVSGRSWRADHS